MAKLTKHAEMITKLHEIVVKQAEAADKVPANLNASVKDTGAEKLDDAAISKPEQDKVDSNNLKDTTSEKKPSTDKSEPAKTAAVKGQEILDLIAAKQAEAADKVPADLNASVKDTGAEKTQDVQIAAPAQDKVDSVKLEDTTSEKKPSTDKSEPAKTASDLAEKVASYEVGRQLAVEIMKRAAAATPSPEVVKEAGARDFDALIAAAAAELAGNEKIASEKAAMEKAAMEKQAEDAGAAACDAVVAMYKQAAVEQENAALKEKIAELEGAIYFDKMQAEKQAAELAAKQAEEREQQKVAYIIDSTAKRVIEALKSEAAPVK